MPSPELVKFITQTGAEGLLLIAVMALTRVIIVLWRKNEAREEQYISIVKEQIALLTQIREHLQKEEHESDQ